MKQSIKTYVIILLLIIIAVLISVNTGWINLDNNSNKDSELGTDSNLNTMDYSSLSLTEQAQYTMDYSSPELCDESSNPDFCYLTYATGYWDKSICDNLPDGKRDNCVQSIDELKFEYLENTYDLSRCENEVGVAKDQCEGGVLVIIADRTQDQSICDQINVEPFLSNCNNIFNKVISVDNCDSQFDTRYGRDLCYEKGAYRYDEVDFCQSIVISEIKNRCLLNL